MKANQPYIAFISEHASPLATLGGVDTGGQNVYVAQVAKYLVRKGYMVDYLPDGRIPKRRKLLIGYPE